MEVFGWNQVPRPVTSERRFQLGTHRSEIKCWAALTLPTDFNNTLTEVPRTHFTDRETEASRHYSHQRCYKPESIGIRRKVLTV